MFAAAHGTDGVNFSIRTTGTEAIARALVGLQLRAQNLHEPLAEIGAMLLTATQDRFEQEKAPDGTPWEPLATPVGRPMLRDTVRLFHSLTYAVGRNQVEIGTNVVYARIHQMGGETGRDHASEIPARPYLGLSAEDEREALDIVTDYLKGGLS